MEAVVSADQELRPPLERETEAEKKLRYRSIRIAHLTMFTFSVGFSVVLTGVYPYLKEVMTSIIYNVVETSKLYSSCIRRWQRKLC